MADLKKEMLLSLLGDEGKSQLMKAFLESNGSKTKTLVSPKKLKECYKNLVKKNKFKVGDLVQWKSCMKNRKMPQEGEPAIILEIYEDPIFDEKEKSGTPYFREPYNIVLGVMHHDGNFLAYHLDSRRFEPYTGE